MSNLPDAAAEFARQLVTALAGDAGRLDSTEDDARLLRTYLANEQNRRRHAELAHDRLRGAVQEVLRQEGDLLTAARAQLLRDALGKPDPGPDRWPGGRRVSHAEAIRVSNELGAQRREHAATAKSLIKTIRQREELLAAARDVLETCPGAVTPADVHLLEVVTRIRQEIKDG